MPNFSACDLVTLQLNNGKKTVDTLLWKHTRVRFKLAILIVNQKMIVNQVHPDCQHHTILRL